MKMILHFFRLLGAVGATVAVGSGCGAKSDSAATAVAAFAPRDTAMIDSIPSCASCRLSVVDWVRIGATTDTFIPVRSPGFCAIAADRSI